MIDKNYIPILSILFFRDPLDLLVQLALLVQEVPL